MEMTHESHLAIYYIACAMTLVTMIFFLVKGKKSSLLYSFVFFQWAVLLWILRIIYVQHFVDSLVTRTGFGIISYDYYEWLHYEARYFVQCLAGASWLLFCLNYTSRNNSIGKKLFLCIVASFPFVYFIPFLIARAFLTQQPQNTLLFWVFSFPSNVYYLAGMGLLIKNIRKKNGLFNKQSFMLLASILFPYMLTFIQDYKRSVLFTGGILPNFDITPLGFIAAIITIAFATYRYRFLNVLPIALRKLVKDMNQAIVVLDESNRMIDCNYAFSDTFLNGITLKKNRFLFLLERLKEDRQANFDEEGMRKAIEGDGCSDTVFEMSLSGLRRLFFSVEIQPILSGDDTLLGKIVMFKNITEYKRLLEEINSQNKVLSEANTKLTQYASVVHELAVANERNRLSRDLHDTLGHTMTMLLALLEVSDIACEKDPALVREKIREASGIAREGLREIQRSIAGIVPGSLEPENLIHSLENLAQGFRATGVDIDLTVDPLNIRLDPSVTQALYRTCQEAFTNALRHGKASQISVILKATGRHIKLYIIDNGSGAVQINKGYGLLGMEQRIKDIGGVLKVWSDGESGFHVCVELNQGD